MDGKDGADSACRSTSSPTPPLSTPGIDIVGEGSGSNTTTIITTTAAPQESKEEIGVLDIGTLTSLPTRVHSIAAGGGIPELIFGFLLPSASGLSPGVDTFRAACRGANALVEHRLRSSLLDGLLSECAHGGSATRKRLYERYVRSSLSLPEALSQPNWHDESGHFIIDKSRFPHLKVATTVAEALALYRGLPTGVARADMVTLLFELQVDVEQVIGMDVDAPLADWEGVTVDAESGRIAADLSERCGGGNLRRCVLPHAMQSLVLGNCVKIRGPINRLALPIGMQVLNLEGCGRSVSGKIDRLVLPEGMHTLNLNKCVRYCILPLHHPHPCCYFHNLNRLDHLVPHMPKVLGFSRVRLLASLPRPPLGSTRLSDYASPTRSAELCWGRHIETGSSSINALPGHQRLLEYHRRPR